MTIIADSLQAVLANIRQAKQDAGRQDSVRLLAVSKAQPAENLRAAYMAGQVAFGENYLQEALAKQAQLADCAIEWHFIGPIQSNKTTPIAQHFDWVHSVDRLKLVKRLAEARPSDRPPLNVCVQYNSSAETSKSGVDMQALDELVAAVAAEPRLKLRGLMAIPAPAKDFATQRTQFRIVHEAFLAMQRRGLALDTLSIGMSDDYIAAIHEGASMVRIGSALFGARPAKTKE
jgi:pyridoxal phosphate enzyme (YggS family)